MHRKCWLKSLDLKKYPSHDTVPLKKPLSAFTGIIAQEKKNYYTFLVSIIGMMDTKNATGPLWGNINISSIGNTSKVRYLFSNFSLIRTLRSEKWARTAMVVHNRIFREFYKSLKIKVDFGRNLLRDITLQYYEKLLANVGFKNPPKFLLRRILQF